MNPRRRPAPGWRRAAQAACPVAALLLLVACGSAPKKDAAPAPASSTGKPAQAPAPARRVSPYAPAQEDLSKRGNYTAGGLYAPGVRDSAPADLPQVELIPEPEVRAEPRSRYGNRSPYKVLGKSYTVLDRADGYVDRGLASYYGRKFHGRRTSSLEVYDMYTFSAAHKTLPLPSYARVTNMENGESVVVRVNDRGPFHEGRIIDLSYAAAVKLGIHRSGTARVEVRALSPGDADPREPARALAAVPAPAPAPSALDALVADLPDTPVPAATATPAMPRPAAGAVATTSPLPPVTAITTVPAGGREWRFDMRQDGRVMTADEFDAWMRARGARVATGVPGTPGPGRQPAAATPASPPEAVALAMTTPPAAAASPGAVRAGGGPAASDPSPPTPTATAHGVTLQVASFAGRDNAQRALAMVQGAGIGQARLLDAVANGQPVWRLRIGPMDGATAADLATRVAGLGFGPPQVLRDQ